MRRQRHVSQLEGKEESDGRKEEFLLDLKEGGYPEGYRNRIIDQIEGKMYKEVEEHEKWCLDKKEGKPLYRTGKEREEAKRKEGTARKGEAWYRKGGFTSVLWVPATPEGELLNRIKEKLERTIPPKGTRMKLVQKGGKMSITTVANNNQFNRKHCGRKMCQPCQKGGEEEGSKGQCYKGGIGYLGICDRCPDISKEQGLGEGKEQQALYIGESYRTLFRRSDDHFVAYKKKADKSWMWQHVKEEHQGIIRGDGRNDFKFKVTGKYKEPTVRIADESVRLSREERGLREAVGGTGKLFILNGKDEFYNTKMVNVAFTQL
jgi:hypothetical protein